MIIYNPSHSCSTKPLEHQSSHFFWKTGCNRRTAHEHIISCLKCSLTKQAKTNTPRKINAALADCKLALDVVQQPWLQTAGLHYFIVLSPRVRHIGWQVAALLSDTSCWVKAVAFYARFSRWVKHPAAGGQQHPVLALAFLHLQHPEPQLHVYGDVLISL